MKLTKSQAESFQLLYASVSNALLYAEDLKRSKRPELIESMAPVINKLKWLTTALELKIPSEHRKTAREKDHLYFDELFRCVSHMDDATKAKLEKYINEEL